MLEKFRTKIKVASNMGRGALLALGVANRAELFKSMSWRGVAQFTRDLRYLKVGPHVALRFFAATRPQHIALIAAGRSYSYRELDGAVNQLCRGLLSMGISRRDSIALMLPNCMEHVVAQESMFRVGAIAAQIGTGLQSREIAYILDNADAQLFLYHHDYTAQVRGALREVDIDVTQLLVIGAPPGANICGNRFEDLVENFSTALPRLHGSGEGGVIIYTSGTTGIPKGAVRTWRNTGIEPVADLMTQTGMRSDERHLVVSPLYHSAAMAFVKMMTSLGATIVLCDQFDPEEVLQIIERERITSVFMVPTMLVRINGLPSTIRDKYNCDTLRWVMSGAAPLAPTTAKRFMSHFGEILYNFYGATETGTVTLARPCDLMAHPGTVGRILKGNDVVILDEYREPRGTNEVGEIFVRNSMLISWYHNDQESTERSFENGYFSVGDLGKFDDEGYLYLVARKHDMVISGGVNIYPREIEDVLMLHPKVAEAAVIGVSDHEWGAILQAYIVKEAGVLLSEDDINDHCRDHLANYKRPKSIVFVDSFPRTPTGKVLKRQLGYPTESAC